jgi:hypothetical protein
VTIRQAFGAVVLAAPFVALTWGMFHDGGWRAALVVWGIVLGTMGVLALGMWLLAG